MRRILCVQAIEENLSSRAEATTASNAPANVSFDWYRVYLCCYLAALFDAMKLQMRMSE